MLLPQTDDCRGDATSCRKHCVITEMRQCCDSSPGVFVHQGICTSSPMMEILFNLFPVLLKSAIISVVLLTFNMTWLFLHHATKWSSVLNLLSAADMPHNSSHLTISADDRSLTCTGSLMCNGCVTNVFCSFLHSNAVWIVLSALEKSNNMTLSASCFVQMTVNWSTCIMAS